MGKDARWEAKRYRHMGNARPQFLANVDLAAVIKFLGVPVMSKDAGTSKFGWVPA